MATKQAPRIYLDSCCFIDIVKYAAGTLPDGRQNDVWYCRKLLEAHTAGDVIVHTSFLTICECVSIEPGQYSVPHEIQEEFRSLLTSGQYLQLLNPSPEVANLAQQFRWQHGLVIKGADALHMASALERGCIELITTDEYLKKDRIQKAIPVMSKLGMRVISGSKTLLLPDRYRQGSL
jgi:hypothetical protein